MVSGGSTVDERHPIERLLGAHTHQQGVVSDYIGTRISGAIKSWQKIVLLITKQLKNLNRI